MCRSAPSWSLLWITLALFSVSLPVLGQEPVSSAASSASSAVAPSVGPAPSVAPAPSVSGSVEPIASAALLATLPPQLPIISLAEDLDAGAPKARDASESDSDVSADAADGTSAAVDGASESVDGASGAATGPTGEADGSPNADPPPPAASSAGRLSPPPAASPPVSGDPIWNIFPMLSDPHGGHFWDAAEHLLPAVGVGRQGGGSFYLLLLVLAAVTANAFGRVRRRLPTRGLLPRLVACMHVGARTLVAVFGLVAVVHWIPPAYAVVLPWVVVAGAAAAGWSARDFLPDLLAGVVLLIERRVRSGMWVTGKDFSGKVEALGLRAARIRDAEGRIVSVPNRKLLGDSVTVDVSRQPRVEVVVRVPEGIAANEARSAIEDAALLSPWRAMHEQPDVRRDGSDAHLWRVRVRLLEPRFQRAFESALLDHVEETLVTRIPADSP